MPSKSLHFCRHAGCDKLTRDIYCDEHKGDKIRYYKEYLKRYDERRGTPAERGYDDDWKRVRDYKIRQDPLCEICLERNIINQANVVHHIIPLKEGGRRLDMYNLQSLCTNCHEKIHGRR